MGCTGRRYPRAYRGVDGMKISVLIAKLTEIHRRYGDIAVTGGSMVDDVPLRGVYVTDKDGMEVWPADMRREPWKKPEIDGVFLE